MNNGRRRPRLIIKEKIKLIEYETRKETMAILEQTVKEEFCKRFLFGSVVGAAVGLMGVAEVE